MAAEPGKPEEQPVDDVWKAAAYGNMDKTKEFIEADPQLVNKPDATGYVRPTTQIQREISDRAPDASIHHLLSFYSTPPIFTAKPRSKHSRVRTHLHRRHPESLTSPHSRTHTHPRAQVPAPAVGGAQQQSRGCNLPHRTGRGGERH